MASLSTLPQETLQQIITHVARHDLLNLCISHRNLYNCAIGKIYHTIHFLDPDVEVYPEHKWRFQENQSTAINRLSNVARTIESSEFLRSLVSGASFQWGIKLDAIAKPDVLRILKLIGTSLRALHFAPARWDSDISGLFPVTSVNMPYPVRLLGQATLRNDVHSLFSVPTLRHITLHHCIGFMSDEAYSYPILWPIVFPDKSRIGTSNVEYLSIQDTASTDYDDFEQIMIWPKALKIFECTLSHNDKYPLMGPSPLVDALILQCASLEQISVDFFRRTCTTGTFGTSFRQFPKLKRISMPRNFLARIDKDPFLAGDGFGEMDEFFKELYSALPPALDELVLNVDIDVRWLDERYEFAKPQFKEWILELAIYKRQLYPSLRRLVLWESCELAEFTPEEIYVKEKGMLEFLDISQDFTDVGVEFSYKVSEVTPDFQDPYLCFDRRWVS